MVEVDSEEQYIAIDAFTTLIFRLKASDSAAVWKCWSAVERKYGEEYHRCDKCEEFLRLCHCNDEPNYEPEYDDEASYE